MNIRDSFSNSAYADQMHMAERELEAFLGAVTELFGPEQARLAAEDWLDEAEDIDSPPRTTSRDWRVVTVAAVALLTNRLHVALHHQTSRAASTDAKVSSTRASNCFTPTFLG